MAKTKKVTDISKASKASKIKWLQETNEHLKLIGQKSSAEAALLSYQVVDLQQKIRNERMAQEAMVCSLLLEHDELMVRVNRIRVRLVGLGFDPNNFADAWKKIGQVQQ